MAKPNKQYWAKRAAKLEERSYEKGDVLARKLKREYTRAAREIRQRLDSFYMRYSREQGLSYSEAKKLLDSKEAREWKRTLGEYVDEINAMPDGKAKDKLIAELDMRSYASQQDRLSTLTGEIDMEIDRLFASMEGQMQATMADVLEDGYYRKTFDLQQRAGVISEFGRLNTQMVEDALAYPWSGADFSSRIWENKRALLFNARQTLTQGIIQGTGITAMSRRLADSLGKSYAVSERLIRTEANHFHNEADKLAYTAAGVEEYEFVATLDERTCEVCGALDGKHFKLKDALPGENFPPIHPHDRCTTIEYDPEDAADWAASGKPMPPDMTYEQWKEEQSVDFGGERAIIKSPDIQIGRSLGAAAKRDSVRLPDGTTSKVSDGTTIKKVVVFAGKGTGKPVKIAKQLSERFHVPEDEWKKVRGDGYVDVNGNPKHAELHWFETEETGRVRMKVKRWFDES